MIRKDDADDGNSVKLKGLGLKATGPRLKILEIFKQRNEEGKERHLGAEEVYRILVDEGEDVGLATVYRVLAQFAAAGILVRRSFEQSGTAVYELDDGNHHDHIICVHCGKVEEFNDAQIEERQREVAASKGYKLVDHSMALYGICKECQEKENKK